MFHCTICGHRIPEECSIECTCCCVTRSDEYYRDESEYFGGDGSHP